jgi:hypothetical protein
MIGRQFQYLLPEFPKPLLAASPQGSDFTKIQKRKILLSLY